MTHIVELVVEAAGVAHRLAVSVPSPECGRAGPTIAAARALALGARLKLVPFYFHCRVLTMSRRGLFSQGTHQTTLGLHERAIRPVHFIIETTGIAEIVTIAVPPPQRCRGRPAVHTFSPL